MMTLLMLMHEKLGQVKKLTQGQKALVSRSFDMSRDFGPENMLFPYITRGLTPKLCLPLSFVQFALLLIYVGNLSQLHFDQS